MKTQVIFKINKELKDKAMRKSREEGVPFAVVLKLAVKAFVEGELSIGVTHNDILNDKTRKMLDKSIKNIVNGKDISRGFSEAKEAIDYLRSI